MSDRRGEFDAVICGAGVAGMACAIELARAGRRVAVLETRKKLGGRATSFTDPRSGEELDNCQHVALGCCTHYLHMLDRLGTAGMLRWHSEQFWIEDGGRRSVIRPAAWLPAPMHGAPAILSAAFLSVSDKVQLVRGIAEVATASRAAWKGRTFAAFLDETGQGKRVRRRFWEPVVVSACNVSCEVAHAAVALKVFQDGFLGSAAGARIGVPGVPLARLYGGFNALIERAGGEVMLGASVAQMGEHAVVLSDGREITGERVVCALPYERAVAVVEQTLQDFDERLMRLRPFADQHSPIIGVHVCFERPALDVPHAVLVEAEHGTQWLFARPATDGAQVLHAVISSAASWDGLDEAAVTERVLADIHAHVPASREADVRWTRMVREKRATFMCSPAFESVRPGVEGHSALLLAGDYCNTGWPATMESAARAGHAAASAILGREAGPPDLAPGILMRARASVDKRKLIRIGTALCASGALQCSMLKRLMNWLLGKDAPTHVTPSTPSHAQRAATMIAEAKPTIRTAPTAGAPASKPLMTMSTGTTAVAHRSATTRKPEQHEIALRAHQIWLERGGEATANWLQAEHELAERYARQ